jgi:Ser/Thr protein kinase RdoA (MazF antagonist)
VNSSWMRQLAAQWLPEEGDLRIRPMSGPHRPVYLVEASAKTFVLKDCGPVATARLGRRPFDAMVMAHVAEHGVSVPVPAATNSGQLWLTDNGRVFTLHPYLGASTPAVDATERLARWASAGAAIGALHQALATFPMEVVERESWREDLAGRVSPAAEVVTEALHGPSLARFRTAWDRVSRSVREALVELPEQTIHRDCHPGNVVAQRATVVGFVDCDHFCIGPRIFDLAYYAIHNIKFAADEPARREVLHGIRRLLDAYERVAGLNRRERVGVLPAMIGTTLMFAAAPRMAEDAFQREINAFHWLINNSGEIGTVCAPT